MKLNEIFDRPHDPVWRGVGRHKGVLQRVIDPERVKREEDARKQRDAARKAQRLEGKPRKFTGDEIDRIGQRISDAIGQTVPDGDPFDILLPWLERKFGDPNGSRPYDVRDILDRGAKSIGAESYSEYCADMWDLYYDQEEDEHHRKTKMRFGDLHDDPVEEPNNDEHEEPYHRPQNPWR